jgi:hypothetical protein
MSVEPISDATTRVEIASLDRIKNRLRLDSNPIDWMRQLYDGVIIDTLTGAVTLCVPKS